MNNFVRETERYSWRMNINFAPSFNGKALKSNSPLQNLYIK